MSGPLERVTETLSVALAWLTDGNSCCLDPAPCRTALYLGGEVPWDTCETGPRGTNGQLWAKLIGINPVTGGSDAGPCPSYNWTAEVGIVRCVASLDNNGNVPSPSAIEADATLQARDADAIWNAFRCCDDRPEALRDVTLASWAPLGPTGKCAGGAWILRGRLDVCCE